MTAQGKVYFVGAGPGAEGLITIEGHKAIEKADIIFYDDLTKESLLDLAPQEAKQVAMSQKIDEGTYQQSEIIASMVEKTLGGEDVVYLKGGDPFFFGRGGEEIEELAAAEVDYEVIPGITSALAVPAYAGIPLTHRDYSSSLAVLTGRQLRDEERKIDWENLAHGVETLVILMGLNEISQITESLIEAGSDPKMPAAVVRMGTNSKQKTVTGTLATLETQIRAANFRTPAVIIIGEVVKLRDKLKWWEEKPLFGREIILTRPEAGLESLGQQLIEEGAEVLRSPAIEVKGPQNYDCLDKKLAQLDQYDGIIFTSPKSVEYTLERLFKQVGIRTLAQLKLGVIGNKTEEQLAQYRLKADYKAREFNTQDLATVFDTVDLATKNFLIPHSNLSEMFVQEYLQQEGATVDSIIVYRIVKGAINPKIKEDLPIGAVDLVVFNSPLEVRNFFAELNYSLAHQLESIDIACRGEKTAYTVQNMGLSVDIKVTETEEQSLVEAIKSFYQS